MESIKGENLEFPEPPEIVTTSASDYFKTSFRNLNLFFFVINNAITSDYIQHHAKRTLESLDGQGDLPEANPVALLRKEPGPRTLQLRNYRQELLQAFYSRMVDNFEVYLVEILREVLRQKPEILRNRQQTVTLDYVIQFSSIDDLIQDIIEVKVNSLSYKGFSDLEQWYAEKGIPLIVKDEHRQAIIELIATRNIIVHNRGRIDEKFLRSIPMSTFKNGEIRELEVEDLFRANSILSTTVSATDHKIALKFNLKTNVLSKSDFGKD